MRLEGFARSRCAEIKCCRVAIAASGEREWAERGTGGNVADVPAESVRAAEGAQDEVKCEVKQALDTTHELADAA